jgi:hypothetical protein
MKKRNEKIDSLAAMIRSQREEIQRHRWIESEKVGYDIGLERAEREWRRQHASVWREWLRSQDLVHPIIELIWSQQEEIEKFKWIESERRGHDVGWECAVLLWRAGHYEDWRRHTLEPSTTSRDAAKSQSQTGVTRPLSDTHRARLSASMKAWWDARRKMSQN